MSNKIIDKIALGGMLLLASWSANANLLTNSGFETNVLANWGSTALDIWIVESASITGPVGNVTPVEGSQMLSMGRRSDNATQAVQFIDVSAWASQIDAGNAVATAAGMFNIEDGAQAKGLIQMWYLDTQVGYPNWGVTPAVQSGLDLDGNSSTWENISVQGVIPSQTRWIGVSVLYVNSTMTVAQAFVDDVSLIVTPEAVPEPSLLALLLGAMGITMRAQRKHNHRLLEKS